MLSKEPFDMGYQLPQTMFPLSYDLEITSNFSERKYSGVITTTLMVLKRCSSICFHTVGHKLQSIVLTRTVPPSESSQSEKTQNFEAKNIEYSEKFSRVNVTFGEDVEFTPDEILSLEVKYSGELKEKMNGDEPSLKATMKLSLVVEQTLDAISNTPIEKTEYLSETKEKKVTFKRTPKMSTYLVAWVIGNLVCFSGRAKDGTVVSIYSTPISQENYYKEVEQLEYAKTTAIRSLDLFNQLLGVEYSSFLEKLDLVSVENLAGGGMENWGLITVRKNNLLVDKNSADSFTAAKVICHEIAHQWFGNLVTLKNWGQLWLNEGFARFLESYAVSILFPRWNIFQYFQTNVVSKALFQDSLENCHSLDDEVSTPEAINESFDDISYCKGGCIVRLLFQVLGPDKFFQSMTAYLTKFKFGCATSEGLWETMSEVVGWDVGRLFGNYTRQKGAPLLICSLKYDDGNYFLEIKQQRFVKSGVCSKDIQWNIPIIYKRKSGNPVAFTMSSKCIRLQLYNFDISDWIKVNFRSIGYYRVAYSSLLLKKLYEPIKTKVLSYEDRVQLITDCFDVAFNGNYSMKISDVLQLVVQAFDTEDSFYIIQKVNDYLDKLLVIFQSDEKVVEGIRSLAIDFNCSYLPKGGGFIAQFGAVSSVGNMNLAMSRLYKFGYLPLIQHGKDLVCKYLEDPKTYISGQFRNNLFVSYVKNFGKKEYEEVKKLFEQCTLETHKRQYMRAMCHTQVEELLDDCIKYLFEDSKCPMGDVYIPLRELFANKKSRSKAWEYMKKNWNTFFVEKFAGSNFILSYCINSLCEKYSDLEMVKVIEEFFEKNPTKDIERTLSQGIESIKSRAKTFELMIEDLRSYFI